MKIEQRGLVEANWRYIYIWLLEKPVSQILNHRIFSILPLGSSSDSKLMYYLAITVLTVTGASFPIRRTHIWYSNSMLGTAACINKSKLNTENALWKLKSNIDLALGIYFLFDLGTFQMASRLPLSVYRDQG